MYVLLFIMRQRYDFFSIPASYSPKKVKLVNEKELTTETQGHRAFDSFGIRACNFIGFFSHALINSGPCRRRVP